MSFDKPASPEELLHYGIKGMKWGVRKERDANGETSRQRNRRLNKEFTKSEKAKRDAEIDAARERYSQNARKNYLDAKAQYKLDKKTMGTRAARAKFDKVKQKNIDDYELATQAKSGRETTVAVLSTVGTVALVGLLQAAASSRR